jgi:hypothetical protein
MKTLQELKNFSFESATADLWVVKKRVEQRQARYTARWVEISGDSNSSFNLESQLVGVVKDMISMQKDEIEYDYVCNPDEYCLLKLRAEDTNMPLIIDKMKVPGNECRVSDESELMNAAGYVIKIQSGDNVLYAFKKTSSSWKASKVKSSRWAFFNGECMIGISQDGVFQIHKDIDFVFYEDTVFIADKRSFESAMNYKDSMIERRDIAVMDLEESGAFKCLESLKNFIGEDMRYLRSISSILDKGFYKQTAFIERLKAKNEERNWGIQIDDEGKIILTEDKMSDLFKLLNDFRLYSELSHNIYDVPSTQSVV